MKHFIASISSLLLAAAVLAFPASAVDDQVVWGEVYCFSSEDLTMEPDSLGIVITDVPSDSMGSVFLGTRKIVAGDVLTQQQAQQLTFVPTTGATGDAAVACMSITPDGLTEEAQMTLKIGSGKNEAPTAQDSDFETYKNIAAPVPLSIRDPENDELTVTIVSQPKRGTVEVSDDGTVTYTPTENKVGKDSFTYTVTDTAGNVSEEATVRIRILKPSDKETYQDMDGDPAQLAAMWLKENGIYRGSSVAGKLLFAPEEQVSRGEFTAMCVALTQTQPELLETGFIDGDEMPLWLQPYVGAALKCGYLSGIPTENGLAMEASDPIRQGEAAVMLARVLNLPQSEDQSVLAQEDSLPAWAASAVSSMRDAGLEDLSDTAAPLTRRDAAMLLYSAWNLAKNQESSLLSWAAE